MESFTIPIRINKLQLHKTIRINFINIMVDVKRKDIPI